MEDEVRMTCQEIVDLYTVKKDFKEMTKQIDIYEPYDFFYELQEQFEEFQNHEDDWSIFTGITFEYHLEKYEKADSVKRKTQENLLFKFAEYVIAGVDLIKISEPEVKIYIDDFLEEMEN